MALKISGTWGISSPTSPALPGWTHLLSQILRPAFRHAATSPFDASEAESKIRRDPRRKQNNRGESLARNTGRGDHDVVIPKATRRTVQGVVPELERREVHCGVGISGRVD